MKLDIDTSLRYPDGDVAGIIEKVVFDSAAGAVHEIVISTPGMLGRMVIVPIALLREDPGDVLTIDATHDDVDALPDYVAASFVDAPEGWEMSANYAPGASLFPATVYYPIMPEYEETNLPEGTVEIGQGTEVLCTDGRYGVVDEVILAEDGEQVLAFVVRPDDSYALDIEVPLDLVASADALVVQLKCTLNELPTLATPRRDASEEPEAEPLL